MLRRITIWTHNDNTIRTNKIEMEYALRWCVPFNPFIFYSFRLFIIDVYACVSLRAIQDTQWPHNNDDDDDDGDNGDDDDKDNMYNCTRSNVFVILHLYFMLITLYIIIIVYRLN